MVTLIGSLLGFVGSTIPSVVGYFEKKQDAKIEIELAKLKTEALDKKADIDLKMFDRRQYADEHQRLIDHDIAISNDSGFAGGLRKSVRPVITYCFFFMFAAVKISFLMHLMGGESGLDFYRAMDMVWDMETKAIFSSVISFWFGSRAIERYKSNQNIITK